MNVNVLDVGAMGNGVTSDTKAVQKAVDMCGENGGGVVTFPAGTYMLGKVFLRSHVTISIESGARIVAIPNKEEYPVSYGPKDTLLECRPDKQEWILDKRWSIFYGCDLEGVVIRGNGVIDGNYKEFLIPRVPANGPSWAQHEKDLTLYGPNGFRPTLLMLENCENTRIEGVNFFNAGCYTINLYTCNHLQIRGIRIENDLGADNADGIHMTSCSDVLISDCDLTCGDDSIAIDTDEGKPAERYVIKNCIIASRNNCFRIFHSLHNAEMYEKLPYCRVRDIVISSCVVRQADSVVCMNADKGEISNVLVTGIRGTMTRNGGAFIITSHNDSNIDGVVFSDWSLRTRGAGYMYAEPGSRIDNVVVSHYDVEVCPKTQQFCMGMDKVIKAAEGPIKGVPFYWWSHHIPFFMQIINAENVELDDVKIKWGEEDISDLMDMHSDENKKYIDWVEKEHGYPTIHKPTLDWPAIQINDTKSVITNRLQLIPHGNCEKAFVEYKNGKPVEQ